MISRARKTPASVWSCANLVLLLWTLAVLAVIRTFFVADTGGAWGWWGLAALVLGLAAVAAPGVCKRVGSAKSAASKRRPARKTAKPGSGVAGSTVTAVDETGVEESKPGHSRPAAETLAREDEEMSAKLADLPEDASAEARADTVGSRPEGLDAPEGGKADDLKRIKGIGRVNEDKLNELGIHHFHQIAAWGRPEVRWVTTYLAFPGRIDREDWLGQAGKLAGGDDTEFSRRVDAGDVASSLDDGES